MLTSAARLSTTMILLVASILSTTTAAPSSQLGGPAAFSGTSGPYSGSYGGSQASVYAPNTLITTQANIHANTDIAPQVNVAPTIPIPYAEPYSVPVPVASAYPYPVLTTTMWSKKRGHNDCSDDDCCNDWDDCCCDD